jgi:hypothetical protein
MDAFAAIGMQKTAILRPEQFYSLMSALRRMIAATGETTPSPANGLARTPPIMLFSRTLLAKAEEPTMSTLTLFTIIWAVMAACFLALIAYRGQLTRYEEDQLFLSDNNSHEQIQQQEIVRKVNRIGPAVRILGGLCGLLTMGIVGSFAWDAWTHIR